MANRTHSRTNEESGEVKGVVFPIQEKTIEAVGSVESQKLSYTVVKVRNSFGAEMHQLSGFFMDITRNHAPLIYINSWIKVGIPASSR